MKNIKRKSLSLLVVAGILIGCAEQAENAKPKEDSKEGPLVSVEPKEEAPVEVADEKPKSLTLEESIKGYLGKRKLYEFGESDGSYTVSTQMKPFSGPITAGADALELAKIISMHVDFNSDYVTIAFTKMVPDEYGNDNEETVFIATFSNITLAKIDIANVDDINVAEIATEYFVSPAIEF